jgi:hypothetical protein
MIGDAEALYQQAVELEELAKEIDQAGANGQELDAQRVFAQLRRQISGHRSALAIHVVRVESEARRATEAEPTRLAAVRMIASALELDEITPQVVADLLKGS